MFFLPDCSPVQYVALVPWELQAGRWNKVEGKIYLPDLMLNVRWKYICVMWMGFMTNSQNGIKCTHWFITRRPKYFVTNDSNGNKNNKFRKVYLNINVKNIVIHMKFYYISSFVNVHIHAKIYDFSSSRLE